MRSIILVPTIILLAGVLLDKLVDQRVAYLQANRQDYVSWHGCTEQTHKIGETVSESYRFFSCAEGQLTVEEK